MRELNIEEIRTFQLDILRKVAKFCDDNKIMYFLCGGTLLGAVRHKGYIPWDDDIDIMMPRDEHSKFLKSFEVEGLKLYDFSVDPLYDKPFSKVAENSTLLIEHSNSNYDIGINIDIFPIDGFPNDKREISKHLRRIERYRNILTVKQLKDNKKRTLFKRVFLMLMKPLVYVMPQSILIKNIISLSKSYSFKESVNAGISVWGYGIREVCPKFVFEKQKEIEFEGELFKGLENNDIYLSNVYGNYMELPPENKRQTHHVFKAYIK